MSPTPDQCNHKSRNLEVDADNQSPTCPALTEYYYKYHALVLLTTKYEKGHLRSHCLFRFATPKAQRGRIRPLHCHLQSGAEICVYKKQNCPSLKPGTKTVYSSSYRFSHLTVTKTQSEYLQPFQSLSYKKVNGRIQFTSLALQCEIFTTRKQSAKCDIWGSGRMNEC